MVVNLPDEVATIQADSSKRPAEHLGHPPGVVYHKFSVPAHRAQDSEAGGGGCQAR